MSGRRRHADNDADPELVSELKDAFDMFDATKKGYLDKDDLRKLFKVHGVRVTDEDLDSAFREADADGDKKIECMEFINMMTGKMKATSTEKGLTEAFKVFDPSEKGVIDSKELTEALLNIGEPCTNKEVNELMNVAQNQDGDVRYELFVQTVFAKK
ncbi:Calmodulin [Entamoeba marina]